MLRGDTVILRARRDEDVAVLQSELYDDVETRSRADTRPWRPVSPGTAGAPYSVADPNPEFASFSVVEIASDELAGVAVLWNIDTHNRLAHIGMALRPAFRGRGLGADAVRVLCRYGFATLGLHRLQIETLADNATMIHAATGAGFVVEGTLRSNAWANGAFFDEVILGLLAAEWTRGSVVA